MNRRRKTTQVEITLESGDRIPLSDKDTEHARQMQASCSEAPRPQSMN